MATIRLMKSGGSVSDPFRAKSRFVESGKSGIRINPKNKGKFTAAAKRAGMGVQEYARKVLNDPNASPLLKKRANFARNAAKFKH